MGRLPDLSPAQRHPSIVVTVILLFLLLVLTGSLIRSPGVVDPTKPAGSGRHRVTFPVRKSNNWLVVDEPYPSEKYDFVNWDDGYSQLNGKIKVMFQSSNQFYVR